eukprot:362414-Chlamydomonas_euryale.AAC.2
MFAVRCRAARERGGKPATRPRAPRRLSQGVCVSPMAKTVARADTIVPRSAANQTPPMQPRRGDVRRWHGHTELIGQDRTSHAHAGPTGRPASQPQSQRLSGSRE